MQDIHARLEWMADSDEPLLFEEGVCRVSPGVQLVVSPRNDQLALCVCSSEETRVLCEWHSRGNVKSVISEFFGDCLKILVEVDSTGLFKLGRCRNIFEGVFDFDLNLLQSSMRVLS